jgi:hypothetical protein
MVKNNRWRFRVGIAMGLGIIFGSWTSAAWAEWGPEVPESDTVWFDRNIQEAPIPATDPSLLEQARKDYLILSGRKSGRRQSTGIPETASSQPAGALAGVVVYCSGGHGFGANSSTTAWIPERPLINAVNEDMGNIDQLNYFAEQAWKAGATVVPVRPVGYQTNEVVLNNVDTNLTASGQVTFGGTWADTGNTTLFYGTAGEVGYRYASVDTADTTAWAIYRPTLPAEGEYPVYTWVRSGSDRANQLYRVYHSGGVTDVRVDHSQVGLGWVWLGTYHFEAGTNGSVNISNHDPDGAGEVVIADAIRFGNGMGDVSRGAAGLSGFEQELESGRFWMIKSMGVGMATTLYDLSGYDDREDNIGQPARMAANMCRTNGWARWRRVYIGFHSNAGSGSSRGAIGLYDTRIQSSYPSTWYKSQTNLAAALARQSNEDMRAGVISGEIPSWSTRTTYLYGSAYGELYNSSVYQMMDTTINEVAFHDNTDDIEVLKTPAGREWLARSSVRGVIKHLAGYYASGMVNTNAPDRPVQLKALNSASGAVTVSWSMPTRSGASGGLPQGFILYASTNGKGFGNPISVSGASATNQVITNLNAGATLFFRVCATNAGGESLHSALAGARVTAGGTQADVLVVDGFSRNDASLTPTRYFANGLNGQVALVRPRMINYFDYVTEHGLAIASAGQTFDSVNAADASAAILNTYGKVVWILGEESTVDETFSSAEQTAVTSYLNGGGCLMVSGAEIGWDIGRGTAADQLFMTNVLRAAYSSDSGGTRFVTGTAAGFLSGESIVFNYTNLLNDIYAANYPDVLSAGSGATVAAVYGTSAGGGSGAIIQYSNATYRTIVMGFPFETITNAATRATLMTKALTYLAPESSSGAVQTTLSPAGAISAGAQWVINGTTNASGSVSTGLVPGNYTVTFTTVSGYSTPSSQAIVVSADATNILTGVYTADVGDLTVTLTPAAARDLGAAWSVDSGTNWYSSGETASNLPAGRQYYTFQEVAGYTVPSTGYTTIIAGTNISRSYAYSALPGALTVNLAPAAAVTAGATWSLDGGSSWHADGATVTNLSAGSETVTFSAATGFNTPASQGTTISPGATQTLNQTYTLQTAGEGCIASQGFDSVDETPWNWSAVFLDNSASVTAIDYDATVATSTNKVLAGTTAVRLQGSTNGLANPALQLANVDISGHTNVTLTVPFASAGADSGDDLYVSVSYDAGATWSPSAFGTQIADGYSNLKLDYNVFSNVTRQPQGTPYVLAVDDSRTQLMVRVAFFDATTASGNANDFFYLDEIQLTGQVGTAPVLSSALSVTLSPAAAVSTGAQWQVDSGIWRTSGAVVTGLTAGAHTVSFSTVSGWVAPSDVATQTTNGTTNAFSATYTEEPDTNIVTILEDDFEDGDLVGWTQDSAGNWVNSASGPITGAQSLKHNLSAVAATNYITAQPSYDLSDGTTTWQFRLKNGSWDPSGANYFHVYLMASDTDLTGSTVDGYTVGINVTGTDDLVKLWRISNGSVDATVLTSALNWDASMTNAIEVTRTTAGEWELKTGTGGSFTAMTSAGTATDTTYTNTATFGLVFECTSTRAGLVWMDDVLIQQAITPAATDTDDDGIPDDYETANYGGATNANPNADDDSDGASNLSEYIAGTDPQTNASVLAVASLLPDASNLVFSWPSATGRVYSIWMATNAISSYTQHVGSLAATAPTNTYTNTAPSSAGTYYYGIKVSWPTAP